MAGDEARRARCQASSCSRRRAGGGPGAPRSPAAADANLCPPAQQAARGRGRPPAWWGGWRGHGRAAPAHLALPPPLLRQDSELRPPSLQGQAVMACGDTPPAMSPPHPCCPHTASAPLSAPRPPSAPTNTPVTTPGIAHHPQWLSVPSLPLPTSPTTDCSSPLSAPAQPNLLITPNAFIPQISNSLPRSISQPSIPPEIPHHSYTPSPHSIPTPSITPTPHIPSKHPLGIPHLLL